MTKARKSICGILLSIAMVFTMIPMMGGVYEAYAVDVKDYITIKTVTMQDEDGNDIDLNKSDTDTGAYTNGLYYLEKFGFAFTFDIDMGQAALLQNGDTAEFPITYDTNSMALSDTTAQPLYATGSNGQQVQIGTWQVNASQKKVIFTFNDTTKNSSTYTNGVCKTDQTFNRSNAHDYPEIRNFGIDNVSVKYLAEGQAFTALTTRFASKLAGSASNNKLTWTLFLPNSTERYLTDDQNQNWINNRAKGSTWLQGRILHKNVFIEDAIEANDVTISAINGCIRYPVSDTSSTASINTGAAVNIKSAFTEIKQNSGESIDDFRLRIKSNDLQYGVYDDGNGTFTAMVYLGTFPSNSLKWEDPAGRWSASSAINNSSNSAWTEGRKERWLEAHGTNNVIDGNLSFVRVALTATYPVVEERTQKTNTATYYHENDNNNFVPNADEANPLPQTATGYIAPGSSDSVPVQRSVKLIKYDVDDETKLSGATFKLERKNDSSEWVSWSDSQGTDEWATDSDGMLLIEGLVNGDYRFVESGASSDEYDIDSAIYYSDDQGTEIQDGPHFSITNDDSEGILIYCSNEKLKYGDIVIEKKLAGNDRDSGKDKDFEFTVKANDKDGNEITGEYGDVTFSNGTATVTITGEGTATIKGLPDKATYTIKEKDYTNDGYDAVSWDTEPTDKTIAGASPASSVTYTATNTKNIETKAKLSVTKTSNVKDAHPGDTIPYIITIKNTGEGDAKGVEVVDTMGDGLSYVSDDANGTNDGQKVTWTVDVPAGGSKTININCQINESATGKVVNTVEITPNPDFELVPEGEGDEFAVVLSANDAPADKDDDGTQGTVKKVTKTVVTGDDANLLFFGLLLLAAIGIMSAVIYRRKRG